MIKSDFKIELIKLSLCSALITIGTIKTIQDFNWINLLITIGWSMFYITDFKGILENFNKIIEND